LWKTPETEYIGFKKISVFPSFPLHNQTIACSSKPAMLGDKIWASSSLRRLGNLLVAISKIRLCFFRSKIVFLVMQVKFSKNVT
jgi:hypothetical protein